MKCRGRHQTKPTGLLRLLLFLWLTGVGVSAFSPRIGTGSATIGSQVTLNLLGSPISSTPSPGYSLSLSPSPESIGTKLRSKGAPLRETTSRARGLSSQEEVILLPCQYQAIAREFEKKEALSKLHEYEATPSKLDGYEATPSKLDGYEATPSKLDGYDARLEKLRSTKAEYPAVAQIVKPPALGGAFSETALRSVVKCICWRVVAGSVTFATSLQFSGSMMTALQLVGADFSSKAVTMLVGERLMNQSKAGRAAGSDSVGRSAAKALMWRLFAVCNTLGFALLVSKDWSVAGRIASTDAVFKTALMFANERAWAGVQWGKEHLLEYAMCV